MSSGDRIDQVLTIAKRLTDSGHTGSNDNNNNVMILMQEFSQSILFLSH